MFVPPRGSRARLPEGEALITDPSCPCTYQSHACCLEHQHTKTSDPEECLTEQVVHLGMWSIRPFGWFINPQGRCTPPRHVPLSGLVPV